MLVQVPGEPNYKCTAALLDANHALTSASCVLESDAENNTLLTNISEMVFVPGAIISPSITTATQSLNYKGNNCKIKGCCFLRAITEDTDAVAKIVSQKKSCQPVIAV